MGLKEYMVGWNSGPSPANALAHAGRLRPKKAGMSRISISFMRGP